MQIDEASFRRDVNRLVSAKPQGIAMAKKESH